LRAASRGPYPDHQPSPLGIPFALLAIQLEQRASAAPETLTTAEERMKRYLMLTLLGLFTFGVGINTVGCRAEVDADDDDAELKVDRDKGKVKVDVD
jgi:hypothetical protein